MKMRPTIPDVFTPLNFFIDKPVNYEISFHIYTKFVDYLNQEIDKGTLILVEQTFSLLEDKTKIDSSTCSTSTIRVAKTNLNWKLTSPDRTSAFFANYMSDKWKEVDEYWSKDEFKEKSESWYGVSGKIIIS